MDVKGVWKLPVVVNSLPKSSCEPIVCSWSTDMKYSHHATVPCKTQGHTISWPETMAEQPMPSGGAGCFKHCDWVSMFLQYMFLYFCLFLPPLSNFKHLFWLVCFVLRLIRNTWTILDREDLIHVSGLLGWWSSCIAPVWGHPAGMMQVLGHCQRLQQHNQRTSKDKPMEVAKLDPKRTIETSNVRMGTCGDHGHHHRIP